MTFKTVLTACCLGTLTLLPVSAQAETPTASHHTVAPAEAQPATQLAHQADVGAASSGVWTFITSENCYDLFLRSCTSSFPSPQCPPDAAGKTCSPINSYCWDTVSPSRVDYYRCR